MASPGEVANGFLDAGDVVGSDAGDGGVGDDAVDEDGGNAAVEDPLEVAEVALRRGDQAIDALGEHDVEVAVLLLGALVGIAEEGEEVEFACPLLNGLSKIGEKRIPHIGKHQADGLRAGLPEGACLGIGAETQRCGCAAHRRAGHR